jgi:hypothetical protein
MELLLQFLAESPTPTLGVMEPMLATFEVQGNTVVTDVLNNKVTNFIITEPTLITIPSQ